MGYSDITSTSVNSGPARVTYNPMIILVFIAGLAFLLLSVTPARQWIINSIPKSMKFGVGAGIGLFLAIIGLQNAGIVVDNPATLVGLGDVSSMPVMLSAVGFAIMAILDKRGIPGSIIIGIGVPLTAPSAATSSVGSITPADVVGLTGLEATAEIGTTGFGTLAYKDIDITGNTSYTDVTHAA